MMGRGTGTKHGGPEGWSGGPRGGSESGALFPYASSRAVPKGKTPFVVLDESVHVALVWIGAEKTTIIYREDVIERGFDPTASFLAARDHLARIVRARLFT